MYNNKPVIVICGDGDHGKTTVMRLFGQHLNVPVGSTGEHGALILWAQVQRGLWGSNAVDKPIDYTIESRQFVDKAAFDAERKTNGRHRVFMADFISHYNSQYKDMRIAHEMMESGVRVIEGVRRLSELVAISPYVDLKVWVNRPGKSRDPSMQFGPEQCDIILENRDGLSALEEKVRRVCFLIGGH